MGKMNIWSRDCLIIDKSRKKPGYVEISGNEILISMERVRLFGLLHDGFDDVLKIRKNDLIDIQSRRISNQHQQIDLIASNGRISLLFQVGKENSCIKETMRYHLDLSEQISGSNKFSMKEIIKEYYHEIGKKG